jgi:hypothetical protein
MEGIVNVGGQTHVAIGRPKHLSPSGTTEVEHRLSQPAYLDDVCGQTIGFRFGIQGKRRDILSLLFLGSIGRGRHRGIEVVVSFQGLGHGQRPSTHSQASQEMGGQV